MATNSESKRKPEGTRWKHDSDSDELTQRGDDRGKELAAGRFCGEDRRRNRRREAEEGKTARKLGVTGELSKEVAAAEEMNSRQWR